MINHVSSSMLDKFLHGTKSPAYTDRQHAGSTRRLHVRTGIPYVNAVLLTHASLIHNFVRSTRIGFWRNILSLAKNKIEWVVS